VAYSSLDKGGKKSLALLPSRKYVLYMVPIPWHQDEWVNYNLNPYKQASEESGPLPISLRRRHKPFIAGRRGDIATCPTLAIIR